MAKLEVLTQLRDNQPQATYGIAFEKLMVNYFRTDPTLKAQFDEVYRWTDWRYNGGKATGIDLVACRVDDRSDCDPVQVLLADHQHQ